MQHCPRAAAQVAPDLPRAAGAPGAPLVLAGLEGQHLRPPRRRPRRRHLPGGSGGEPSAAPPPEPAPARAGPRPAHLLAQPGQGRAQPPLVPRGVQVAPAACEGAAAAQLAAEYRSHPGRRHLAALSSSDVSTPRPCLAVPVGGTAAAAARAGRGRPLSSSSAAGWAVAAADGS